MRPLDTIDAPARTGAAPDVSLALIACSTEVAAVRAPNARAETLLARLQRLAAVESDELAG